jgi:hypothetical protein
MDVSIRKGFRPKGVRRTSDLFGSRHSTLGKVEEKFIVNVNVVRDVEIAMPALQETEMPIGMAKRVLTM